jgi:HKD family nuclease
MNTIFLSGPKAEKHVLRLIEECRSFSCAVAWATDNAVSRAMEGNAGKSQCLVIGTHRFGTCPDLLARFANLPTTRVVQPTGNLFHPKIYLFRMADGVVGVVGSHNLTAGAFGRNVEASVLISGPEEATLFRHLFRFVEDAWNVAELITDEFLKDYARQYEAKQDSKDDLCRFHRSRRPRGDAIGKPMLDLSWREFVRAVAADREHGLAGRLDLLDAAHDLFEKYGSLSKMKLEDRHRIAGTEGVVARRSGPFDWGWFGAMGGFGTLRGMIATDPSRLSRALDEIPLYGRMTQNHYAAFSHQFRRAFDRLAREGRIPSATRLLAIKRPDVFICFNQGNSKPICDRLGVAVSAVNLDNYWEHVIEPIQASRWWQSSEPDDRRENRIWRGRAAMIDAIYYQPV